MHQNSIPNALSCILVFLTPLSLSSLAHHASYIPLHSVHASLKRLRHDFACSVSRASLSQLSEDQLAVYTILAKRGKMLSGELYKEYCRAVEQPVVDRAYRKWMRRIVKIGLVRESGIRRWRRYEVVA